MPNCAEFAKAAARKVSGPGRGSAAAAHRAALKGCPPGGCPKAKARPAKPSKPQVPRC